MKRTFFARAPPGISQNGDKINSKNKQNKKGESQNLFAMYISSRFSAWVFTLCAG